MLFFFWSYVALLSGFVNNQTIPHFSHHIIILVQSSVNAELHLTLLEPHLPQCTSVKPAAACECLQLDTEAQDRKKQVKVCTVVPVMFVFIFHKKLPHWMPPWYSNLDESHINYWNFFPLSMHWFGFTRVYKREHSGAISPPRWKHSALSAARRFLFVTLDSRWEKTCSLLRRSRARNPFIFY